MERFPLEKLILFGHVLKIFRIRLGDVGFIFVPRVLVLLKRKFSLIKRLDFILPFGLIYLDIFTIDIHIHIFDFPSRWTFRHFFDTCILLELFFEFKALRFPNSLQIILFRREGRSSSWAYSRLQNLLPD